MNTKVITEIAEYISKETGYEIPPMTPFVGENFKPDKSRHPMPMACSKNHEIYNISTLTHCLTARQRFQSTAHPASQVSATGSTSTARRRGLEPVDKKSPLVRRVYDWVQEQYDEGRITIISDAELTRQTELAMEAE